jgi:D-serine deaminase-like pyridoxal phosphate-dependent protein
MDTTQLRRGAGRQTARLRRHGRILLAVVGLTAALLASACDTAQQVPWASYNSQLQPRIDAARATGNCAALQVLLTAAKTTSRAHEKATGFPNDALVSYIQAAQHQAGCPAGSG